MCLSCLQSIDDQLTTAIQFHRENEQLYAFLALHGFEMLHLYQYITESETKQKLKKHIITMYDVIQPDCAPRDINLIAPLIGNVKRSQLSANSRWTILQNVWNSYIDWEKSTLDKYIGIAKQLINESAIVDYNFVNLIIDDVTEELINILDSETQMAAIEWDMPQILAMQTEIYDKYYKKLQHIY